MSQIQKINNASFSTFLNLLDSEKLCMDIDLKKDLYYGIYDLEKLVGSYGLEVFGRSALLRSVVLAPSKKGIGLGSKLITHSRRKARENQIENLYLLTTTAKNFFEREGFREIQRTKVPESIGNTVEFKSFCPDSATCMQLNIPSDDK